MQKNWLPKFTTHSWVFRENTKVRTEGSFQHSKFCFQKTLMDIPWWKTECISPKVRNYEGIFCLFTCSYPCSSPPCHYNKAAVLWEQTVKLYLESTCLETEKTYFTKATIDKPEIQHTYGLLILGYLKIIWSGKNGSTTQYKKMSKIFKRMKEYIMLVV